MFFQMGSRNTNKGDTEWDLTQVLEAGMAIPEEEDEALFSLSVTRHRYQHTAQQPRRPRRLCSIPVEAGFVFSLTTTNPLTHPLPHPHLLQLHAAVMRVCRAAGMAVEEDEDWDSSDGEGRQPASICDREADLAYTVRRYLAEQGYNVGDSDA